MMRSGKLNGLKKGLVLLLSFVLIMTSFTPTSLAAVNPGITLNTSKNSITKTNAVLYATINNPYNKTITDVGIVIQCNGTKVKDFTEKCNSSYKKKSSVPMWYDLNKELGLTLSAGTKYSYEMFAYIGGKKYTASDSFTTVSEPKATTNPGSAQNPGIAPDTTHTTVVPYYHNNDSALQGQSGGCRTCSMAMVLTAIGVPNATVSDIFAFNGNSTYLSSLDKFKQKYGVTIEGYTLKEKGTAREDEVKGILQQFPSNQQIVYVNTKTDYGEHAYVAYLNSKGELRINDPGDITNGKACGEGITLGQTYVFYTNRSLDYRWNAITSLWIIKYSA